jgi:hypothetical protein
MDNGERALTTRQEFGAVQTTKAAETAVTAAAAQARAQVEAMYVMALQRPRDMMAVRQKLLRECGRTGFAEAATYTIPRGGKQITGPSIRFAEAALRSLGNVHVRTTITYEDAEKRIGEVTVVDLEANVPLSAGFTIDKSVERRKVTPRDQVLGERINSTGEVVYLVSATEADVLMKQESYVARLRRNLILQLLPGDLRDEALARCDQTLREGDAKDPAAAARKLADAFASLGISAAQLREYLGHAVDQLTPDEAGALRGVYSALRDQQTTWAEVVAAKAAGGVDDDAAPKLTDEEKTERAKMLKAVAAARVKDKETYTAVREACGIQGGVRDDALPLDALRNLAKALEGAAKAAGAAKAEG